LSSIGLKHLGRSPFITVFQVPSNTPLTAELIRTRIESELRADDVLIPKFLTSILLAMPGQQLISTEILNSLMSFGNEWADVVVTNLTGLDGPYLWVSGNFNKIHRLHDDVNGSFMAGLKPSGDSGSAIPVYPLKSSDFDLGRSKIYGLAERALSPSVLPYRAVQTHVTRRLSLWLG
jgi:hypothetical protein